MFWFLFSWFIGKVGQQISCKKQTFPNLRLPISSVLLRDSLLSLSLSLSHPVTFNSSSLWKMESNKKWIRIETTAASAKICITWRRWMQIKTWVLAGQKQYQWKRREYELLFCFRCPSPSPFPLCLLPQYKSKLDISMIVCHRQEREQQELLSAVQSSIENSMKDNSCL